MSPCCCVDALRERDEQIIQSLAGKQQILAALFESAMEQETPHKGLLLRGDATDLQQGEKLLKGAIDEGEAETLASTRVGLVSYGCNNEAVFSIRCSCVEKP